MEMHRMLEISIMSAEGLKDVRHWGMMQAWAVASMPPYVEYTTQINEQGGTNPVWNEKFSFMVPEVVLQKRTEKLKIEIWTVSTLGQKLVGVVNIPISDFVSPGELQFKSYPVKTASGEYHGELFVSFLLGDKIPLRGAQAYPIWNYGTDDKRVGATPPLLQPYPPPHDSAYASPAKTRELSSYPSPPTAPFPDESPLYTPAPPQYTPPAKPREPSSYTSRPASSYPDVSPFYTPAPPQPRASYAPQPPAYPSPQAFTTTGPFASPDARPTSVYDVPVSTGKVSPTMSDGSGMYDVPVYSSGKPIPSAEFMAERASSTGPFAGELGRILLTELISDSHVYRR